MWGANEPPAVPFEMRPWPCLFPRHFRRLPDPLERKRVLTTKSQLVEFEIHYLGIKLDGGVIAALFAQDDLPRTLQCSTRCTSMAFIMRRIFSLRGVRVMTGPVLAWARSTVYWRAIAAVLAFHHPGDLIDDLLHCRRQPQVELLPFLVDPLKLGDAQAVRDEDRLVRAGDLPANSPGLLKAEITFRP